MADTNRPRPARARPLRRPNQAVLVIGLGRFGGNLALTLVRLGHSVLGIDRDPERVRYFAGKLTKVVEADSTDIEALEQLGVTEFNRVVVCIGSTEPSVLTVTELVELGVTDIWAKALTDTQARILERVGASRVVRPEHEMGERVAHMVTGKMLDYIELDAEFALVETLAPRDLHGKDLASADVRGRYGVTVVCLKPRGEAFTYATADTVISEGDILLVAGETSNVEGFAALD